MFLLPGPTIDIEEYCLNSGGSPVTWRIRIFNGADMGGEGLSPMRVRGLGAVYGK